MKQRETPRPRRLDDDLGDADLTLYLLGELGGAESRRIDRLVAEREDLQERLRTLAGMVAVLDGPVPEPRPGLESRVWQGIQSGLEDSGGAGVAPATGPPAWWSWTPAVALAAGLLLFGLSTLLTLPTRQDAADGPRQTAETPTAVSSDAAGARQRVLIRGASRHAARSERLLRQVANARPGEDLSRERRRAAELLRWNRLYRRVSMDSGAAGWAYALEDLEPVLIQLSHLPQASSSRELRALQARLQRRDLLFRFTVLSRRLEAGVPIFDTLRDSPRGDRVASGGPRTDLTPPDLSAKERT